MSVDQRGLATEQWRHLFEPCLACQQDMARHHYFKLASVVLGPDDGTLTDLADLVKRREWSRAAAFQDFDGMRDCREYYVIRCAAHAELSLVSIRSLFELWADDYTESRELLESSASINLARLIGDRWHAM